MSQRVAAAGATRDAANTEAAKALLAKPVTVTLDHVPLRKAVDAIGAAAGTQFQFRARLLESYSTVVTLRAEHVPLSTVLDQALRGTTLQVVPLPEGAIAILANSGATAQRDATGTITGTVRSAATKQPVRGATVSLDGASRGVLTDENGVYLFPNVTSGMHKVAVKYLGYARQTQMVSVENDAMITADVMLQANVNQLDQIVVTGTVVRTELKAVPNAITVVTAKDIEQRGITHIDQLFRGDVPGLFAQNQGTGTALDEVTMFSRGASALSGQSSGVSGTGNTNPIKTYIDGVELADPKYLSQIDPRSIERIEILTGPQASTIYGSNAINGVMQIFTKRGTTNLSQLTFNLLSGWVENNYSTARTPQHAHSAQVNGVEGRVSYSGGGSWDYTGPWAPAKQMTRTSAFGGVRAEFMTSVGRVTSDATLRRTLTQNKERGNVEQGLTGYRESGWYSVSNVFGGVGLSAPQTMQLNGQTLGITLGYNPTRWWSHELTLGRDDSDTEKRQTAPGYRFRGDTGLYLSQAFSQRRSLRYTTTTQVSPATRVEATATAGVDGWQNLISSMSVSPQALTGTLNGSPYITRQPGHNTGAFVQTQLSISDRLFLTYGLRAEWNPTFGDEAQPNYAPRYGVAYTQELGSVTVKMRGSYGRATRPPSQGLKQARTYSSLFGGLPGSAYLDYYGDYVYYIGNSELAPERQQGGEGGLELYWSSHGSLVVTHYNQTIDGLISSVYKADSVRSAVVCPDPDCAADILDTNGFGYLYQYQNLNVGSIRNQGWELQGTASLGPFTTKGTYSWTKSRTIGVTPKYRMLLTDAQYQPGATFQYLPEHTWTTGVTYNHARTTAALSITGTGRLRNFQNDFLFSSLRSDIRLMLNRLNMNGAQFYVNMNVPYALADVNVAQRVSSGTELVLQVQNLANRYVNDSYAGYSTIGRQTRLGARLRFQ